MTVSSAAGILALLSEDDPALLHYALQQLDASLINQFWAEISDDVSAVEVIYENTDLPQETRQLAALLASKVYYHLGSLDDALSFALSAGNLFRVGNADNGDQDYTDTIVATCIDRYIAARAQEEDGLASSSAPAAVSKKPAQTNSFLTTSPQDLDKMHAIVERMLDQCIRDSEYRQALGIGLDSRRLDIIERIFAETKDSTLLAYVLDAIMTIVVTLDFRNKVLRLLVRLFSQLPSPDHFSMVQCFVHLNDPALATELLRDLLSPKNISADEDAVLKAYQIAFDLADTASQDFLTQVSSGLGGSDAAFVPEEEAAADSMETDQLLSSEPTSAALSNGVSHIDIPSDVLIRVQSILSGHETNNLHLEFLHSHAHTDLQILQKTKDALEARNSIFHNALSFSNAFMNAGTCSDKFLRDNLDWLAKASNWGKFSATAALGVIHRGNLEYGMQLLSPYLPTATGASSGGPGSSVYSEGGALYALGLVHANNGTASGKGKEALAYLRGCLKAEGGEVIQHGAALGLGVAAMATGNEELYEELREILFGDNAVSGEAAGYAMGLVMLGTASSKAVDEMLQYAHETQHEKIIRGLAVGISLLMYGKQEEAESVIETLMADKDPILRYGGIHTVAMAYAGTGANAAIRRLLHVAVSDVNDDVRRAAVTSLGFILFRSPAQVPRVVQLLSESYNPHVRYGATIALGVSCAGTGLTDAIDILQPLTKDPVDFVRQGSCIALSMILIQQNTTLNPKVDEARKLFEKVIADKHEDPMAKFGAALSQGLIDAGGRNVTISLASRSGNMSMPAVVGLSLFTQFWYWFPLAHAAVLAFTPTAVIGVNKDLKLPKFDFISNAKPSIFAYVPELKAPEKKETELVKTAVLSTTAKTTARQKEKDKEKAVADGESMETDDASPTIAASTEEKESKDEIMADASGESQAIDAAASAAKKKAKEASEPGSETLSNVSRVVPAQMPYISVPSTSRYTPVRPLHTSGNPAQSAAALAKMTPASILESVSESTASYGAGGGILVLKDRQPDQPEDLVEVQVFRALQIAATGGDAPVSTQQPAQAGAAAAIQVGSSGPIAAVPQPFQYDDFQD